MSRFKGDLGLGFISIFFVMGILMFVIVDGVIANSKLTALTNFEISLEADDRGTEILALLQSDIEGSYLDKISSVSAENYKEYIDLSNLNSTVKKLSRFEGNYSFDIFEKEILGESKGEDLYLVDIPVAGGETKKLKIRK